VHLEGAIRDPSQAAQRELLGAIWLDGEYFVFHGPFLLTFERMPGAEAKERAAPEISATRSLAPLARIRATQLRVESREAARVLDAATGGG
jgi:hypothetical protein